MNHGFLIEKLWPGALTQENDWAYNNEVFKVHDLKKVVCLDLNIVQIWKNNKYSYNFEKLDIVSIYGTIIDMNTKNKKVLKSIFDSPVSSSIPWKDIELLLVSLGAEISEGNGSRVRIALNGIRAVFHRPHPQKETDKGAIMSMRRFLKEAGVKSC